MSSHNGRLVDPTDEDKQIIDKVLAGCVATGELLHVYIKLIREKHLFLEVELVNLQWVLTHLQAAEKELNRLKERVQHDGQDISDK